MSIKDELKETFFKKIKPKSEVQEQEPQSLESTCCEQCNMPLFMMCWRHKFRQYLTQNIKEGGAFTDEWRKDLSHFISTNGSLVSDQPWQMGFYEYCKQYDKETPSSPTGPRTAPLECDSETGQSILQVR